MTFFCQTLRNVYLNPEDKIQIIIKDLFKEMVWDKNI